MKSSSQTEIRYNSILALVMEEHLFKRRVRQFFLLAYLIPLSMALIEQKTKVVTCWTRFEHSMNVNFNAKYI